MQSADHTRGHIENHTQTRSTQDTDGQQRADNRTPGGRAAKHILRERERGRERDEDRGDGRDMERNRQSLMGERRYSAWTTVGCGECFIEINVSVNSRDKGKLGRSTNHGHCSCA